MIYFIFHYSFLIELICSNARQEYVENAVGHMQIKKENDTSIVFARVHPETTLKGVPYIVELQSNKSEILLLSE
jgi:hypothetical protein